MIYFDDMKNIVLSSQNIIYMLYHPESPFAYVGQSMHGMKRVMEHFKKSTLYRTRNDWRTKWIKNLEVYGLTPLVKILEECTSPDDLDEAEVRHIARLRAEGVPLLNHTDGGAGMRGYKYTEERLQKHIEDMKQRAATDPNYSEKMSAIAKAQWTEEKREAISNKMKGNLRTSTPHARAAASAAHKGKPKSPEARAKMSAAKKLKWQDPVYRARQVAAQIAAKSTPEAKAKAAEWAKLAGHEGHRTPEYRARTSARVKAYLATPEGQAQRSEQTTRLWKTDEYREKAVDAITAAQRQRRERERKEDALRELARHQEAWDTVIREYVVREPRNREERSPC